MGIVEPCTRRAGLRRYVAVREPGAINQVPSDRLGGLRRHRDLGAAFEELCWPGALSVERDICRPRRCLAVIALNFNAPQRIYSRRQRLSVAARPDRRHR
jgi:hypothetical protein